MTITLNKVSATPCAYLLGKGIASTHFVKQSDTVRMKRFPFLDFGDIGPRKSIATWYHGKCTGVG